MGIGRLVLREILYRKLNFGLSVLSVLVAVGCLVAELTLLRQHDLRSEQIVAAKEQETGEAMRQVEEETAEKMRLLEDDYRKITKNLGFNILILPRDQNLSDLYAEDFATKYMPEEYVDRLAKSKVATINHLLPSLQQKVAWPEQQRTIILIGTRGEVPILHLDPKKPILDPVPTGAMVLGHELHASLSQARGSKLKPGDRLQLLGREFKVHKLHPPRGNKEDITIWINLAEAQKLLKKEGQINAILALECNCSADRLDKIREEVAGILPETQVIELATQALARAEARNRAATAARDARDRAAAQARDTVEREKTNRAQLRGEKEGFAALLVPLVLLGSIVWLGALAFANVRERTTEIGIWRALGLRSRQILTLFLSKAMVVGFIGAVFGYAAGSLIGLAWEGAAVQEAVTAGFNPALLGLVLVAAPVLCGLAASAPAMLAARQDPAVVLREE